MGVLPTSECIIRCRNGKLRGERRERVDVYRGIPYAMAPMGVLRFHPPEPAISWSGTRDATESGPVPPQRGSRLAPVTGGELPLPQSEACLTLNVWTPRTEGSGRPVMVWLHGGGFMGGAGSHPWFDGAVLAERGDAVVVTPNFRQGALGHLVLPGVSRGNLALQDVIEALRWVRANIEAFGGDPARVTVFAQSSGAVIAAALLAAPAAQGLLCRAILQSPALGRPVRFAPEAAEWGLRYLACLKLGPGDAGALRDVPVAALLQAQAEFSRTFGSAVAGASDQPFGLVTDGEVLVPLEQGWGYSAGSGISLMVGTVREEQAAAYHVDPGVRHTSEDQLALAFDFVQPGRGAQLLRHYRSRRPSGSAEALLGDLFTDVYFRVPALRLAERHASSGHPTWAYQFNWQSPAGLGACHCIEIPFVFGNRAAWSDAPMLKGLEAAFFQGLSATMQDAWLAFARTGDPNSENVPWWRPYGQERQTLCLDSVTAAVGDAAGMATHPLVHSGGR